MTPLFALFCAVVSFWAGLSLVGWQFLTGVVWLGGCIAWSYWYAFGEVKPTKERRAFWRGFWDGVSLGFVWRWLGRVLGRVKRAFGEVKP